MGATGATRPVPAPPVPAAAHALLVQAQRALAEAATAADPLERYAGAHLAALRATAALLAVRTRPAQRRGGPRTAWDLLARVAPELAEWAAFFAAGAGKRAAAEAGLRGAVSLREADDLVRDTETYLEALAGVAGLPLQPLLARA